MKIQLDVLVDGGKLCLAGGRPLPSMKPKLRATLVIEEEDIVDPLFRSRRLDTEIIEIDVSDGVAIRLASARAAPPSHKTFGPMPFIGARIKLAGPLRVRRKIGQLPTLPKQTVILPDLGGLQVESLNQACTRLSERFEPERKTHTYSAFEVVFVRKGDRWFQLKEMV